MFLISVRCFFADKAAWIVRKEYKFSANDILYIRIFLISFHCFFCRQGRDIDSAKVGDPLALRFEILENNSPYEIFVRELVAMDGVDASEILLIDSIGKDGVHLFLSG